MEGTCCLVSLNVSRGTFIVVLVAPLVVPRGTFPGVVVYKLVYV